MIESSVTLPTVVAGGSFRCRFTADLVVEDTVVISDLLLEGTELTADASGSVLTTAKTTVVYADEFGTSITPRDVGSWLAPFVSRLDVYMQVQVGGLWSDKVLRGRLPIIKVGDVQEAFLRWRATPARNGFGAVLDGGVWYAEIGT